MPQETILDSNITRLAPLHPVQNATYDESEYDKTETTILFFW